MHQHRLGSCRGLLVVSRDGVAFVPEEANQAQDAFNFQHGQFLHVLEDDSLTIKSNDRTYRFKSAVAAGKDDNQVQLQGLVASIASFR